MSHLKFKRQFALKACDLFQVPRWWGRLDRWHGLVTLNYHRVGDLGQSAIDSGVFSTTPEEFEAQLKYLKTDCDVVRVADIPDVLKQGSKRRCVLISFDDGYADNYEVVFPALKQAGLSAVIFLTTGFLDERSVAWWDEIAWIVKQSTRAGVSLPLIWKMESLTFSETSKDVVIRQLLRFAKTLAPGVLDGFLTDLSQASGTGRAPSNPITAPWLTWEMVREMHRAGIDFGGHTVTHPVLSRCTSAQQEFEIRQSKARIEQELGAPITAFSYPIGQRWSFTDESMRLAREAGYQYGFSFYPGYASASSDRFDLRRVSMQPGVGVRELRAAVQIPRLFTR